ncbi:MAG: SpoIIE family protein phosphatase [Christensenellales bacterium]
MELTKNSLIKNKLNTKFLKILTLVLLFILLYGTNNTYVYYSSLMPFGVGLVFSLFYIKFNGYILGILYLISYVLAGMSLDSLFIGLNVLLVLSVLQGLDDKGKLKLNKPIIFVSAICSQILYVVFSFGDIKTNLALLISIILGILFLFASLSFLDATINKGLLSKINIDEKICGGVILIIFSIGICGVNISIISVGLIFAVLIVLVSTFLSTIGMTMVVGSLIGIGFSLYYYNPIYISMFIVIALASSAFKCRFRFVSVIASVLAYILFTLIFGLGFSIGEVLSVCIGGIVFCIIPYGLLKSVFTIFSESRQVAIQNVFNSSKSELVSRVKELSKVFAEMDKVYRDMVKGNMSEEEAKKMLKEEIISEVCSKCSNYNNCFRANGTFMDNCFDTFINIGYEKKKILLIDLPEYLTTNCVKVNSIIQYTNNIISAYLDYRTSVSNIDTSRILIAEQLGGVSNLLNALSKEVDVNVSFSNKYENILKENLGYIGVICVECVVYEKDDENKMINIIVKNNNVDDKRLEKIVSKAMNCKFRIDKVEPSNILGASSIILKSVPKYDIAFGSAVATKTGKTLSGDTHSILDIGDGKYIVSICDGMGSGKNASNISKLTISLIENFYRAGFDNDIILNSVNILLSLTEQENFSTIDICMIDCKRSIYDFIKLGATSGYIKHTNGDIEEISSSGLPVGVLEDIRPHITKKYINPMDIIILTSDGISDVIGDEFKNQLRNIDTINPQVLANQILNIALEKNGGVAMDDMTVICIRVFENV